MTKTPRVAVAATILLAAPLAVLFLWIRYANAVPDPVPTHWDGTDEVDGTTSLTAFTLGAGGVATVGSLVGLAVLAARAHLRITEVAVAAGWLAWLLPSVYLTVMVNARGATSAGEVHLGYQWVAVVLVVPVAAAAAIWWLLPRQSGEVPVGPPHSSLTLGEDERVVWVGQARSRVLLGLASVAATAGAVLTIWSSFAGLTTLGVALLLSLMHYLTVRVDREAVTVTWGPLRFLRHRLPLDTLAGARIEQIEPLRWGGWGYRVSTRGRAAVVRRGSGLVLTLRTGSEFAVTVDRPEGAVELVNALLADRRTVG
ncbi:hypothetical protein [Nocardioides sp. 616]|uniref:hypothetical protein n=1 Tax=Nocardioides sp. 616 TaxID=2268090 RepID=UPI000CE3E4F5|nr:hypothetical protein [Nocardioides sp. 616]